MNALKKIILFVLLLGDTFGISLMAQGNLGTDYIPSVIPPSPNAAALMRFSDVPVSPYTGTADVTVPIYTIKARGIDVPVSISYHTGGVRLKDEASWVGLGWALNAGGMISRTIMGQDDFNTSIPYFTTGVPQVAGDMTSYHPSETNSSLQEFVGNPFVQFWCNYLVNTTGGNEDYSAALTPATTPIYDMEPDIYSYSFPGHSGKFIITRAGNVILQKQENITFQYTSGGTSFTVTDDQGNKFYFAQTETVQGGGSSHISISSWLLSKITTQLQDSVVFTYTPGGASVSTEADVTQTYTYAGGCQGGNAQVATYQGSPTQYSSVMLQSISFSNGQLQFFADSRRSDLGGGSRLDSVQLFSKNSSGSLTYLKQHNFYYSYFNSFYIGNVDSLELLRLRLDSVKEISSGVSTPPYSFIYSSANLGTANSAKHSYNTDHWGFFNGAANSVGIPTLTLEYSPAIYSSLILPTIFTFTGGNREPNFEYASQFGLQQVNYPTGGYSVFNYQANDYDYRNSANGPTDFQYVTQGTMDSIVNIVKHKTTSGSIDLTYIFPQLPSGSTATNLTINLTFRYQNNYSVPNFPYENTSNKITFNFSGQGVNFQEDINEATCTNNSPVCTISLPVTITTPGVYTWSAYIDSAAVDTVHIYSETKVEFQYSVTQQNYNLLENNSLIAPASGLRIQSIINYSATGVATSEKTYTYDYLQDKLGTGNPQQYSYGRLMSFPAYARYSINPSTASNGQPTWCSNLCLFSSSYYSLTSSIQGNIVGYDQVTESNVDPSTGQDIGKTVYAYYNSADTALVTQGFKFPGCPNIGNSLDGLLLSKTEYSNVNGSYQKVSETDNSYHTTNRIIYYSCKYQNLPQQWNVDTNFCVIGPGNLIIAVGSFYPSIKSERILFDSSYNYTYDQSNPASSVLTVSRNYYDNSKHYQVTRSNTKDSKGNSLTTHLRYAQDYIPNGQTWTGNTIIDTMIQRNMVSETIEKQDSLYYSGSGTGYITGAQLSLYRILTTNNNTVIPDKIYKLDIQSPITNFSPFSFTNNVTSMDNRNRQMISFDQYDSKNNIQQYTTTDQNPVTIIWDYVNVYPIAKVTNASLADVAATSFEADGKGGWTFSGAPVLDASSPTGSQCYGLSSGNITKSGLTSATTYVVSYWSKTGSSYTVTGSTAVKQGKTINGWTYFEHTVSAITSITISGSGSIDELRLYPSTSLMTTYTYAPLNGMTTQCDMDNKITYYFYDGLSRLKWIKDQDGNIIKTFQYHYLNSSTQY